MDTIQPENAFSSKVYTCVQTVICFPSRIRFQREIDSVDRQERHNRLISPDGSERESSVDGT
jgi:hypothetical protein